MRAKKDDDIYSSSAPMSNLCWWWWRRSRGYSYYERTSVRWLGYYNMVSVNKTVSASFM